MDPNYTWFYSEEQEYETLPEERCLTFREPQRFLYNPNLVDCPHAYPNDEKLLDYKMNFFPSGRISSFFKQPEPRKLR